MAEAISYVILSFFASIGFGVVFRIERQNLVWAGVGGALTRCVYLLMQSATSHQFFQSLIAAVCAATFAELMAMYKKMPSTVLLYPSIIPLIPGDLFYNAAVQFVLQDMNAMKVYAVQCGFALSGICIGFVVVSTFTYYRRIYKLGSGIARTIKVISWKRGEAKQRKKAERRKKD